MSEQHNSKPATTATGATPGRDDVAAAYSAPKLTPLGSFKLRTQGTTGSKPDTNFGNFTGPG